MSGFYSIPGVYNALDGSFAGGMTLLKAASVNALALQACIDAAMDAGGGIVIIPATDATLLPGAYDVSIVNIPGASDPLEPLLICGTGMGTTLVPAGTLFNVTNNSNVIFQDLIVHYHAAPGFTGTAFDVTGSSFVALFRLQITDCEYPVIFSNCSECSMLECSITYVSYPSATATTAVQIVGGSSETTIARCLFSYGTGTPNTSSVGILVQESSSLRITDTQVSDHGVGIDLNTLTSSPATGHVFDNVRISSLVNCVAIKSYVRNITFVSCHLQASTNYSAPSAGIQVGVSGATNDKFDTVRFDSCSVTGFNAGGYGLQIVAGRNIQVIGGYYAGNGNAGIGVTAGSPAEIQIVGANCVGPDNGGTPQVYGIYITAGLDITVTGVNCSGTGTSGSPGTGIYISGATDVRVANVLCVGSLFGNASHQQYGVSVTGGASNIYVTDSTLTGASSGGAGIDLNGV